MYFNVYFIDRDVDMIVVEHLSSNTCRRIK